MVKETKERSNDGQTRGLHYKELLGHVKKAKEEGFYLEVITLFESLICDRLESRNTFLFGETATFKTLGKCLEINRKCETDDAVKELTKPNGELDLWRAKRNECLHEMAKLEEGNEVMFNERYKKLESIAKEGEALFRKLDKETTRLRNGK